MNRPAKSVADLRKRVEKTLKVPVPDWAWKIAEFERATSEVLQNENTVDWLAKKIQAYMATGGPHQEQAPQFITLVRKQRRARALQIHDDAVSEAIANIVRQREDVQAFRREVLNGQLLQPEDVEHWIKRRRQDGEYQHSLLVRVKRGFTLGDCRSKRGPLSVEADEIEGYARVDFLTYGTPGSAKVHRELIGRDGILRVVYQLAKDLSTLFNWQEAQATVFLLTDLIPATDVKALAVHPGPRVGVPHYGRERLACLARVTINIDPLITPRELSREYAKLRKQLLLRKPRALSPKHVQLAVFATEYPTLKRQTMEKWGEEFPGWKYRSLSQFGRDARKARSRLLYGRHLNLRNFL